MKVDVFENRVIKIEGTEGTQNENNIQQLEINVPEKYKDYDKKIVFVTDNGIVWDTIEGNTYTIRRNIAKYKRVNFYVWLTKEDDDFRSVEKTLKFNDNHDASDEISEEELGAVNKIINLLEEEIIKVTGLEARLTALIENVQFKLDNGEFNYVLTEEDKQEISDLSVPIVETDIQPVLENIEDVAKQAEIIAKGRATGYVFDTLEDLENWLLVEENVSKLVLGDNLYIRTVGVPDYWWDGTSKQVLETEKPDLTEYTKQDQFVTLTQAEYDALTEKSANTYYFIIEEE